MSTITVVLTTHDRPALADRALASIRAQTRPPDQIIVVDDASAVPYRPGGDDLALVRIAENVGVCAARNHALALADTELITFLDDDDWLAPTFVAEHLRDLGHTTLAAPLATLGTRVFVAPDGRRRRATPRQMRRGESWIADPASTTENSLVVPVEVLRDIGGFDPALAGWEHVDLLQRLTRVCSIEPVPNAEYLSPVDDGLARLSTSWARVADAIEGTVAKHRPAIEGDRRVRARYLRAAAANRAMADQRRRALRLAWDAVLTLPDRRSARTLAMAAAGPRLFGAARRLVHWWRGDRRDGASVSAGVEVLDLTNDVGRDEAARRGRRVSVL